MQLLPRCHSSPQQKLPWDKTHRLTFLQFHAFKWPHRMFCDEYFTRHKCKLARFQINACRFPQERMVCFYYVRNPWDSPFLLNKTFKQTTTLDGWIRILRWSLDVLFSLGSLNKSRSRNTRFNLSQLFIPYIFSSSGLWNRLLLFSPNQSRPKAEEAGTPEKKRRV